MLEQKKPKRRSSKNLIGYLEKFAISLIYEASGGAIGRPASLTIKPPDIPLGDRRALLDTATKFLMAKNKIDPKEATSGFEALREALNGADDTDEPDDDAGEIGSGGDTIPEPSQISDTNASGPIPNGAGHPAATEGS